MPEIQGQEDKEVEEYEEGRINFEKKLERELEKASEHRREGEHKEFAMTVQQIWNDSLFKDKMVILETLEHLLGKDENGGNGYKMFQDLKSKNQFLDFLEAEPYDLDKYKFEDNMYNRVWLEIYRVINNALKRRYYGRKRSWEKDNGFSSSKGGNHEPG